MDREQRVCAKTFEDPVVRDSRAATGLNGHSRPVRGMSANGLVHGAARGRYAADDGAVFAADAAALHELHELRVRRDGAGDDEQTRRVLVQAMDEACARQLDQLRKAVQQCVHQRTAAIPGAGVHHQSSGLVNDDDGVILKYHGQWNIFRFVVTDSANRGVQDDFRTRCERIARPQDKAIDGHRTDSNPLLDARARKIRPQRRQRLVCAAATVFGGNQKLPMDVCHSSLPVRMHAMLRRIVSMLILAAVVASATACAGRDRDEPRGQTAAEIYDYAHRQMTARDYQGAVEAFQRIESRFPFSVEAQQAQLELIYAHYKSGNHEQAEAASDRFLREQPRHSEIDYVHYIRGLINFDRSLNLIDVTFRADSSKRDPTLARKSFQSFATLVANYPESRYAPDAQQRMVYLRNQLARYEIHVADYYMRLDAWAGAVGRAKTVIEEYEGTPSTVDALVILHNAYRRLELDELADDVARVVVASHPAAVARLAD